MNVFYHPEVSGEQIFLNENESGHASRVLRMKEGDTAMLLDGKGNRYLVKFILVHNKKCELEVVESESIKNRSKVHIGIAPTKSNDRMEWFLEKVTEMGVASVTPVICDRSERRTVNHERYLRIVTAAMKQSMNLWMPEINEVSTFDDYLKSNNAGYIAHCNTTAGNSLMKVQSLHSEYRILIGPEGDFTEKEIVSALYKGWKPVSLGESRLRTETAGVVACNSIMVIDEFLSSRASDK